MTLMGTTIPLSNVVIDKNIVGFLPVYNDSIRAAEDFPEAKFIKVERSGKKDGSVIEETTKKTE